MASLIVAKSCVDRKRGIKSITGPDPWELGRGTKSESLSTLLGRNRPGSRTDLQLLDQCYIHKARIPFLPLPPSPKL